MPCVGSDHVAKTVQESAAPLSKSRCKLQGIEALFVTQRPLKWGSTNKLGRNLEELLRLSRGRTCFESRWFYLFSFEVRRLGLH
jgi:hypothetical protein